VATEFLGVSAGVFENGENSDTRNSWKNILTMGTQSIVFWRAVRCGSGYSPACSVNLWLSLGIVLVSGFEKINIEN